MNKSTVITQSILRQVERVCKVISGKTGVSADDLYSECLSKIPRVIANYNPVTGKEFKPYLLLSMRGYCFNFVRDKSFISSISRADISLYQRSLKFPNLEIAANSMVIELSRLERIHGIIKNLRRYSSVDSSDEWKITVKPVKEKNISHQLSRFLSDQEVDIAINHYVEGKKVDKDLLEPIIEKIMENKEVLMELL